MSHNEIGSGPPSHVTLSYFLWLPAGKDEFGFSDMDDAPLNNTAFYRTQSVLERTISDHFRNRVTSLTDDNTGLAHMETDDSLQPGDGELGLRKIHFGFEYLPRHSGLDGYVREGPIPGSAVFLSNGLYLWSFRVPLRPDLSEESRKNVRNVLRDFLEYDFVNRHISRLFRFGWNPRMAGGSPDGYKGILTYYQLDLLFNGIFDQFAHPHLALGEDSQAPEDDIESPQGKARQTYGVRYLIESLSVYAYENEYEPLFDNRKSYTLRRTYRDSLAYVNSGLSLASRRLPATDEDGLHERELFLSRVSFAAMEQFLRVAISFGLTHYKTGLDHIRSELVSQGMQARKNSTSNELRRPSLRDRALTQADLETYYSLLAGKVPTLSFLRDLVDGLSEVTKPFKPVAENGVPGAIEFRHANSTLDEARTQFNRMISAIELDIRSVESSLGSVRADTMILELSESRKLSEIAAELPHTEVEVTGGKVRFQASPALALLLGFVGLLIGFMEVFSNVGVWITDTAVAGSWRPSGRWVATYWVTGFILIALAGLLSWLYYRWKSRHGNSQVSRERTETHVFDYSSLLRDIKGAGRSAPLMDGLRKRMVDIENPTKVSQCASFQTFHETPSSGIERVKYSLESRRSDKGLAYILHIEFDHRLSGKGKGPERLLDIRLVVRKPADLDYDVVPNAHRVIAECVKLLLFPGGTDDDVKNFCLDRFGWDPSPTPTGAPAER